MDIYTCIYNVHFNSLPVFPHNFINISITFHHKKSIKLQYLCQTTDKYLYFQVYTFQTLLFQCYLIVSVHKYFYSHLPKTLMNKLMGSILVPQGYLMLVLNYYFHWIWYDKNCQYSPKNDVIKKVE